MILEFGTLRRLIPSLVLRLSWNESIYRAESLVSFVRKHEVIKIEQKQKDVLRVVNRQRSVC